MPRVFDEILDTFMHPGPMPDDFKGATPELRTQSFGKVPLDCVMLSRPMKPPPATLAPLVPLGLFRTWCIAPGTDRLQLIYQFGNPTLLVTAIGKFADGQVVAGLTISSASGTLATAKLATLTTFTPAKDEFTPPPDVKSVGTHIARIAGGVIAGAKIGGSVPHYPADARMNHISGSVVLRAIIDADGHIRHLYVMSAGDPGLAIAALQAVQDWTYRPYLLNGDPTSVDTTITVNFNLN